jgi:acid phosphatase family membrane protein YuiD
MFLRSVVIRHLDSDSIFPPIKIASLQETFKNSIALTVIATILALIVMYDAASAQQSVGQQSVVLNRIILELKRREPLVKIEAYLRELMGHSQFEVIADALLGIAIASLWLFIAGMQIIARSQIKAYTYS